MLHPAEHVKDPFSAEFKKGDAEIRIAVEHLVADNRDKSELRGQRLGDHISVLNRMAEILKRRIAHAHVYAKRQRSAREFVPCGCKSRVGEEPLADRAEYHRGARAELLHLVQCLDGLTLIAHRQESGPFEPFGRGAALTADIAIV